MFHEIFSKDEVDGFIKQTTKTYKNSTEVASPFSYYIPETLRKITITKGILKGEEYIIYPGALGGLTNVEEIVILNANKISYGAFINSAGLKKLVLPDTLTNVAEYSLTGCTSLESITLPFLGTSASNSSTEVTETTGYTQYGVFARIFSIESIGGTYKAEIHGKGLEYYVPNSLKEIIVTVGNFDKNGNKVIYQYGFSGLTSVERIVLPNDLDMIKDSVFYGCSNIKELVIPFVGFDANTENKNYKKYLFGYMFGTNSFTGASAVAQKAGSSSDEVTYYVPDSLESISVYRGYLCYGAFRNLTHIKQIILKENVHLENSTTFHTDSALETVVIENSSFASIPTYTFHNCNSLTKVCFKTNALPTVGNNNNKYSESKAYLFTSNGASETRSGQYWYYGESGEILTIVNN